MDAPLSLSDVICDRRWSRKTQDARRVKKEDDFGKFRTELGLVLGYIGHANDKDGLADYVAGEKRFRSVEAESVELINVLTDSKLEVKSGEGVVDVCKAIEDMRTEAKSEGMKQGMIDTLASLVRDGVIPLSDAAARAGLTPDEFVAQTVRT